MRADALQAFYQRDMAVILADPDLAEAHAALLQALEEGSARAAQRQADGTWQANLWVKTAILAGFRSTATALVPGWPTPSFDRTAFPPREFTLGAGVRLVPGGSSVRRGAYLAPGVVVMPPAYVNVGAFVDEGTMVDSHALVGSCAQIGKRVHLSAAAQVGGVLEPAGALRVVLSASTRIYDLVHGRELTREVPEGAVVVPGSRPASGAFAQGHGLSLAAPCIVKYRDGSTNAATTLEEALR
jgi:2,3,4,5-tetrahydropyridine-2-carboxylate N-succinyltransferase